MSSLLGGHTIHSMSALGSRRRFLVVLAEVSVAMDHQWASSSLSYLMDGQKIVSQGLENH